MKIVTEHVHPPILTRNFDWVAHYDGPEGPRGYGATEAEAIADLKETYPPDEYEADNSQFGVGS